MLLHGFLLDRRSWRPQIADLARDFTVIAWDAPGCGESSDPAEDFTMAQYTDCLATLLTRLGARSAHLCGLSWGGTAALEFYRRHPARVLSLTLVDTYAGWTGSLGKQAADERLASCLRQSEVPASEWVDEFLRGALGGGAPAEVREQMAAIVSAFHPVGFRVMSRAVAGDCRDVLPEIRVPTLLIWGDDDRRSPLSCAEMMRDAIPDARLVVIPGAGHMSSLERPQRFNEEVREFLRVRAARRTP